MKKVIRALTGAAQAEFLQLRRSPVVIALTLIQAITFLFLVSLFGMTGAWAPTAIIDYDHGIYAQRFIANLDNAHHSFRLYPMDEKTAYKELDHGSLVAIITIPRGFSAAIERGETIPIGVIIDNIDTDMTADIQRALPSAITRFAKESEFPGIHVKTVEHDLIDHDTDFIQYLVVSALAIDALIIAGILSGVSVARELESGTGKLLAVSPTAAIIPILGRILATTTVSFLAILIASSIALIGFSIHIAHPLEFVGILLFSVVLFGCIGAALGAALRKTLPVATLLFSISLPLYLDSNTNEPQRFDGNLIWMVAHLTPVYQVVAILEHAVHDLQVTPETMNQNLLALFLWTGAAICIAWYFIQKNISR